MKFYLTVFLVEICEVISLTLAQSLFTVHCIIDEMTMKRKGLHVMLDKPTERLSPNAAVPSALQSISISQLIVLVLHHTVALVDFHCSHQ